MKKYSLLIALFATSYLPTVCFGGLGYPLCVAACEATALAMTVFPPTTVAGVIQLSACLAECIPAGFLGCFSGDTQITVLENNLEVNKYINDVCAGDIVKTMSNERKIILTKVLKNTKIEGIFEFIQISAQNVNDGSHSRQLRITPTHGIVLMNEDGLLTIDAAEHAVIGDKIVVADNSVLKITEISRLVMTDKYMLETSDGTVLASGIFASTICDEEVGSEQLFGSKMKEWHVKHDNLFNNIQ